MTIADTVGSIQERISRAARRSGRRPEDVLLVGVTKGVPPASVREAYAAGLRHFGENQVQDAGTKLRDLSDIRSTSTWHMIGHLQSNKVRDALPLFDTIDSIDSVRIADDVARRVSPGRIQVLLEVNIAAEPTKSGFKAGEIEQAYAALARMNELEVRGLMTVAPAASDPKTIRPVFRKLKELGEQLELKELSMGMTADFEIAIEEGATMVRIGTGIFGPRR